MEGGGEEKSARAATQQRVSSYVDAQLALLLERVSDAVAQFQRGETNVRAVNRVIEHYYEAELALSGWADLGSASDHVAFLDRDDANTFDWWGEPERLRSDQVNVAVADRESREREARTVRWPWSKVQRSNSSKG